MTSRLRMRTCSEMTDISDIKINQPQHKKSNMASIKDLVGKRMTKKFKFLGQDVTMYKLTVAEVLEIQELAKTTGEEDENAGIELLKKVISIGVEGGDELSDDDFSNMPMDELSNLSNAIMKHSGLGADESKK